MIVALYHTQWRTQAR